MELPKEKQTTLGRYATAKEAYEKWKEDPTNIKILDVRTLDEYINIGHAEKAWNIPVFFQTNQWNEVQQNFALAPNPDFIAQVKEVFQPTDTVYVTCRSGGRSAFAINQLATAGFKNLHNITDGMEGDLISDPTSKYAGKRMLDGWKNAGNPWTYKVDPKLVIVKK